MKRAQAFLPYVLFLLTTCGALALGVGELLCEPGRPGPLTRWVLAQRAEPGPAEPWMDWPAAFESPDAEETD